MDGDTDFDRMQDKNARRYFRFDPTVSTGTILQLVSFFLVAAGAWGTYQADKAKTAADMGQIKEVAASDRAATKEALNELRNDVKEMSSRVHDMAKTLAVMEARSGGK